MRCFILVLDSLGIGAAPDAALFGDEGSDTLGHIAAWCSDQGRPLLAPHLERLGLGAAAYLASGHWPAGMSMREGFTGAFAAANERSKGKDTPSGHWEMTGVPVDFEWGYFPKSEPCFPASFMSEWIRRCDLTGTLGNCHASGTEIIARLGDQHIATGMPIVYTSADSVLQVAAHETHFGLQRLYDICEAAFEALKDLNIARVIARPFAWDSGQYFRTANRRDIAVPPPGKTLLDIASSAGHEVIALGKIGDIFSMRGITSCIKGVDNMQLFDRLLEQCNTAPQGSIVFVNFVDFDQNFGHRRDVAGYANAIEQLDARLPCLMDSLRPDDLIAITADHGCDPTWPGTDHTREYVPLLLGGSCVQAGSRGVRASFCDLGQTISQALALPPLSNGISMFEQQL